MSFNEPPVCAGEPVTIAKRKHPFPSRTRKLSSSAPMILRGGPRGKIGRCRLTRPHRRLFLRNYLLVSPICSLKSKEVLHGWNHATRHRLCNSKRNQALLQALLRLEALSYLLLRFCSISHNFTQRRHQLIDLFLGIVKARRDAQRFRGWDIANIDIVLIAELLHDGGIVAAL